MTTGPVLELSGVRKNFAARDGSTVRAVDHVSLSVGAGETVAIIGESGSGKSTLARLALGLLRCDSGKAVFAGEDLAGLDARGRRRVRSQVSAVFQEPFESLDPRMRVGSIVGEPLQIHGMSDSRQSRHKQVAEALEQVGLGGDFASKYPVELSGGQQQRVSIARAIVTKPRLIVLDEPTSALDLSVQAQVLSLLVELRAGLGMSYLFITHDLSVAEFLSHRIAVMYRGRVVELATADGILERPSHPYTLGLLSSTLSADMRGRSTRWSLPAVQRPAEAYPDTACAYIDRCPFRSDPRCVTQDPPLRLVGPDHYAATFYDVDAAARTGIGGTQWKEDHDVAGTADVR